MVSIMKCVPLLLLILVNYSSGQEQSKVMCQTNVPTIDVSLSELGYCDQPLFFNLLPDNEQNRLLDNMCITFFPLPDDPNTFTAYESSVYCDGSSSITTFIITQTTPDTVILASPFATITDYFLGYAGCDTYVLYRCSNSGDFFNPYVQGLTPDCRPLGLSCLRKVEEIVKSTGLPEPEFYVLPMKLPNRCVTQQLCVIPPNPFYNKLGGIGVNLI